MFSRRQPASANALAGQETTQSNKLFPFSLSRIRSRTSVGTSEADIEMAPVAPAATMVTTASVRESRVVSQIIQPRLKPNTIPHRIMSHVAPIFRNLTLPIPAAMVILIVFVHIGANTSIWKILNKDKGGPNSTTWAPFWVTIPYAIIYVPWWFLVWANNRHSVRQNQPYLSRKMHISVEVAMLGVTVLCFIMMLILSRNIDVQYEVGFPYVTTLAALLGMQVGCLVGQVTGVVYDCWCEKTYLVQRVYHVGP